jgi:hypothetical protein
MRPFRGPRNGRNFTGDFERFYFIRRHIFFSGLRAMCKRRRLKRASIFLRSTFGNLQEGSFTSEFERERVKEGPGNGTSLWGSVRGSWRDDSFTEAPEEYVKKFSGNGRYSP